MANRRRLPTDLEKRAAIEATFGEYGGEIYAGDAQVKPPRGLKVWRSSKRGYWFTWPGTDEKWWAERADDGWVWVLDYVSRPEQIVIRLGRSEGRWTITGLHLATDDGSPLPLRSLRTLPFARLVAALERNQDFLEIPDPPTGPPSPPGRRGYPPEFYEGIANDYRLALAQAPEAPVQWLAERHHVNPSSVHRWLKVARDSGYFDEEQS